MSAEEVLFIDPWAGNVVLMLRTITLGRARDPVCRTVSRALAGSLKLEVIGLG